MAASVTETLPAWAIWVPVVSAGIGGILVIIGNIINNLINKKAEADKQIRDAILKTAIDSWKENMEITKKQGGLITPVETFIMHIAILSDIILDPKKASKEELFDRLEKSRTMVDTFIEFDEKTKEINKKAAEEKRHNSDQKS